MKARHGFTNRDGEHRHHAGKHVVMTSTIAGVKLIALAYTWSQTSIAYFVSTCGVTTPAKEPYITEYEDDEGQVQQRSYPRPQLVSDYYDKCTCIDDDNKLRQHHLALEKKWPTKDPWYRLWTTLLGMRTVSFYRYLQRAFPARYGEVTIVQFVDMMCVNLEPEHISPAPLRDMLPPKMNP